MSKLIFILDDNVDYLLSEVSRISSELGYKPDNVKHITSWLDADVHKGINLFGHIEHECHHLKLYNDKDIKSFIAFFEKKTLKERWFGDCLIITSTNAQSTKKIEKLVVQFKGEVLKKKTPEDRSNELLTKTNLQLEVKSFLKENIHYSSLLPLISELKNMTKDEQEKLTIEDVLLKIQIVNNGVPPWEFINNLLNKDVKGAIENYRKATINSHPLVMLVLLKSKLELLYKVQQLKSKGIKGQNEIKEILKLKTTGSLWSINKVYTNVDKSEFALLECLRLESGMKGNSIIEMNNQFELAIVKIVKILRG